MRFDILSQRRIDWRFRLPGINEHINKHSGVVHWNSEQILDWYTSEKSRTT